MNCGGDVMPNIPLSIDECMEKVHFSGYFLWQQFAEKLLNGETPDENWWKPLFAHPGYAALTGPNFPSELISSNMELAFMPSRQDELKDIQADPPPSYNFILGHFVHIRDNMKNFRGAVEDFRQNLETVIEKAFSQALEFLPNLDLDKFDYPEIHFLVFAADGLSSSAIIFDLLTAVETGPEASIGYLAHEIHHYYRHLILRLNIPEIGEKDMHFLRILDRIHSEGLANRLDKHINIPETARDYHFRRREWFASMVDESPEVIRKINALFDDGENHGGRLDGIAAKIQKLLPMSGNPLGCFMHGHIEKHFTHDEIRTNADNPFSFFGFYNRSAEGGLLSPRFSDTFMEVIDNLQTRYLISEQFQEAVS
jgi:hypothetical protein